MLSELDFYEYFYRSDDELFRLRKKLEKRLKDNIYDFGAFDKLRDVNARIEERNKIYNDLKVFYDYDRKVLNHLSKFD